MVDDLATVDWAALTHAYGSADDVPDLLRGLAEGSEKALTELYGNIWHQGTVYEATAFAVPFLIRILEAPAADPAGVLGLLGSIAHGTSYMDVHRELLPSSQRDTAETHSQMDAELSWVAAAARAVAAGTPVYLRLLAGHPDESVRAAAAQLLGDIGSDSNRTGSPDIGSAAIAGLRRAAAGDRSDLVRARAVLSLRADTAPFLADPEPLPRLAAAIMNAAPAEPMPEPVARIIEREAPACLSRIQRLPGGGSNGLTWVIDSVARHPQLQIRLLTAWLRHPDRPIREAAAHAVTGPLHTWRAAAAGLVPALIAAQQDPSEAVRTIALQHLAAAAQAAAGLVPADAGRKAADPEDLPLADAGQTAADAADLLPADAGQTAADAADLLPADAGRTAADLLLATAERGPMHDESLVWASDSTVGAAALTALCRLRDPRADAVLATLLQQRPLPMAGMEDAVAALGPWATACRAVIIDAIEAAETGYQRARLIRAAGRLGADPAALAPVLRRQVADHPYSAGTLLGDLGPAAAAALPELTAMRAGDDPTRQRIAARALWRITGDLDGLLALLREQIRELHALEILAEVGAAGSALAGLLPPMFDSDYEWRAIHAAAAYWHLTGDAEPVVPVLLRYVTAVPWGVLAVRTLAAIGPAAAAAVPLLQQHVDSPYRAVGWRWGSSDGLIAEDDGWVAACRYALDRIRNETPDPGWPQVQLPEATHQP
ncbi:HEAT repeat domain-containing protein [Actinoplanes sp. NBC_00393]|uniref:HEAT repeat domain-containing protein n=1 Tax=Actinoplanes sp. NBC_00393 TaxID=2975953 RepID=UPI002E2353F5